MLNKILIFLLLILILSCKEHLINNPDELITGTWTVEILYLNNYNLTETIKNHFVEFNENKTCLIPINRFKKTFWDVKYKEGKYYNFELKSSDIFLAEQETNNYLLGLYDLQFYESKTHLFLELSNDSVMILLKSQRTIVLEDRPLVTNSIPYEKFIPYPDFYNEYSINDDYHFFWFKDESYPRIDSNFFELKKNYGNIKPILFDFLGHDSLTKAKSCFKNEYLSIEDVSIVIIDLLENYDINELKNMNKDSCIYSLKSFNTIKNEIKSRTLDTR